MTPLERACTILEQVLLNGPMSFRELRCEIRTSGFTLAGDLVHLARLGFIELDPPLFEPCSDPPPPVKVDVGKRLRLVVDNVRARR